MINYNNAEGQSNGTTVTTGNSGGTSGTAFSSISIGAGGALVYSTATSAHGSQSYSLTNSSSATTTMGWSGLNDTTMTVRIYYNPGATLPSAALRLIDIRNSTTSVARISLASNNRLFMQDYNGANTKWIAASSLVANTWYRIEFAITISTTTAVMKCDYYTLDSTTPVEAGYSTSAANTGSANITSVGIGSAQNVAWTGTNYFDDIKVSTSGGTTYIGPYVANEAAPAPTGVSALAGDSQATISYTTPAGNGGGTITSYTATSSPGGFTGTYTGATASPIIVTGLTNGTSYTFTVHATNVTGNSAESATSSSVTPAIAPGPPTGLTAIAGNAQAFVSFIPPASNGGFPVTSYTVTSNPGNITGTGASSPVLVAGLTNNTSYTFTATATNSVGTSTVSTASNSVMPTLNATLRNSAEGQSDSTVLSVLNSGGSSGDPFNSVAIGSGANVVFSTAASAHGTTSYALTGASGTVTSMSWDSFNDSSIAARMYYNPGPTLPNAPLRLIDIRNSTTSVARISLDGTNHLFMQDYNGTSTKWLASSSLSVNTWYRIEVAITISATTAVMKCNYYALDSLTPVVTGYSTSTGNTGSANITTVSFGSLQGSTWSGTAYYDDVAVNNQSGPVFIGPYSTSNKPAIPLNVSATPGDTSATIVYGTSVYDGGSPITSYTATASPGGLTGSYVGATASPITISGLTNGTPYTFTVHATNANGDSAESTATPPTTPAALPGAPTAVSASVSSGSTLVSFTPPASDGGSPITSYVATSTPGNIATSGSSSPIEMQGLTDGTAYTFVVQAVSDAGTGAASSSTNSVTPFISGLTNTAEGQASGTTASATNTGGGSGDAFDAVTIGSGAGLVFSTTASAHGTTSYALTGSSGTSTTMSWTSFNNTSVAVRLYYNPGPTLPNAPLRLIDIRNSTTSIARISLDGTNHLFMQDYNGANTKWLASSSLTANTWYRIEAVISVSPTAATMKCDYYLLDSTSVVATGYSTSTGNTGSANITTVNFGSLQGSTWTGTAYYDDMSVAAGTTYIGAPLVINAGGSQTVEPWSTVTLDGSLSTGMITSYTWTQTSGTAVTLGGVGAIVTFTAPAVIGGAVLGFRLTITDTNGASLTQDITVTCLAPLNHYLSSGNTWTPYQISYL